MMQLHQDYDKFIAEDTVVVVVGPEKPTKFKQYWSEHSLRFYGIPDENHSLLKLFGQKVSILKLGRMPAQMLIDKEGFLRYVHYGHSMADIPSNEEILSLIKSL